MLYDMIQTIFELKLINERLKRKKNPQKFIEFKKCECHNWARVDDKYLFSDHHPKCEHYKMERIYIVTPDVGNTAPCTEKDIASVMAWIEQAEPDNVVQIVVGELPEGVYETLPEYIGP